MVLPIGQKIWVLFQLLLSSFGMLQSGKEGIYRTFERFSCLIIHIHNAPKTDVAGLLMFRSGMKFNVF
jgi:hypothetical protein